MLALFALAELGVIATLIAFRANACSAIGFVPIGAATMRLNGDGNDEAGGSSPPPTPASQPSAAIQPPASPARPLPVPATSKPQATRIRFPIQTASQRRPPPFSRRVPLPPRRRRAPQ